MIRWEADRPGIVAEPVEAQSPCVADQHAEDAASAWQIADGGEGLSVKAGCDEALQRPARLVDHSESRIARVGQRGGRLDDLLQEGVERQLGIERDAGLEQLAQARITVARLHPGEATPPG